jgi:DNA-binding response OmpR family regulator
MESVKKSILIIDDKPTIAKVVSVYLSKDFNFIYFETPIKAIAWLNEGNYPDLIITDLRMPEMNGSDFLKYLKNNELFHHIPVIILSSEDSSSERVRLLSSGADDYIVKPFNPLELKIRVNKILQQ